MPGPLIDSIAGLAAGGEVRKDRATKATKRERKQATNLVKALGRRAGLSRSETAEVLAQLRC